MKSSQQLSSSTGLLGNGNGVYDVTSPAHPVKASNWDCVAGDQHTTLHAPQHQQETSNRVPTGGVNFQTGACLLYWGSWQAAYDCAFGMSKSFKRRYMVYKAGTEWLVSHVS